MLFYVVESTTNPRAVTAEVAGSSPVVPAIPFNTLQGIGNFGNGCFSFIVGDANTQSVGWLYKLDIRSLSRDSFCTLAKARDRIPFRPLPTNRMRKQGAHDVDALILRQA